MGKEPERLREEGEGRRVEKRGVGRMPLSKRIDVKEAGPSAKKGESKKNEEGKGKQECAGCHFS